MTHDIEKKSRKTKDKREKTKSKRATTPSKKLHLTRERKKRSKCPTEEETSTSTCVSTGDGDPLALDRFRLGAEIKAVLLAKGIKSLFPIQAQTYDLALDGCDVVGRAKTGSGKTLAFVLPIMQRLIHDGRQRSVGRGPAALCLTPTRELAKQVIFRTSNRRKSQRLQVAAECDAIGRGGNVITCCIYGSSPYFEQERALRRGMDFLVGTPGRIKDHINRGNLVLTQLKFQVLDECDQMLQMGFVEDVEFILNAVGARDHIQTLLFSATLPPWVRSLLQKFCKPDYKTIDLMTSQTSQATNCVSHKCVMVDRFMEISVLPDLIQCHAHGARTIVFVDTKANCDKVAESLSTSLKARAIHGDLQQRTREMTLDAFRRGQIDVLVATDVAARGLDIPEVELVIQMSPPKDVESYVHRSGRTGRAEKTGVCICVITPATEFLLRRIQHMGGIQFQWIQPPQMRDMIQSATEKADVTLRDVKPHQTQMFRDAAEKLLEAWGDPTQLVAAALACITGRSQMKQKSLLLNVDHHVTVQWTSSLHRPYTVESAVEQIRGHGSQVELKGTRLMEDGSGIVFDVHEGSVARFMDLFSQKPEISVQILTSLPRLRYIPRQYPQYHNGPPPQHPFNRRTNGRFERPGWYRERGGSGPNGCEGGGYRSRRY